MTLFGEIGQRVGKAVVPIRYSGIVDVPVPKIGETNILQLPLPALARANVFRVPKGILQDVELGSNLLLSLSEIELKACFKAFPESEVSENLASLVPLAAGTWVSQNLLDPLSAGSVNGKTYNEQRRSDEKQASLFAGFQPIASRSDFKKAYARVKTPNSISSHATVKLTIWDLIYPLLLPPLSFDFVPQFDSLERLRPYQMTGISFLLENDAALLADEMGTGKTVMTVVALRLLFRQGRAKRALIICPVSVLRVWQDHLLEWASELEFTVVRGSRETRKLDWQYPAHIYLTTYETVASDFLTLVKGKVGVHPFCETKS